MTGRKSMVISWAKKILQILMNGSLFLDDRIHLSERVDQLLVLWMGDLQPLMGNPYNGAL